MHVKAIALRRPVFMEDEGGYRIARQFVSREEAEAWIAAQTDEFYRPDDYLVVEV